MNYVEKWRRKSGFSKKDVKDKLGISIATLKNYERGTRYDGYEVKIPLWFRMGCAAMEAGLSPIGGRKKDDE